MWSTRSTLTLGYNQSAGSASGCPFSSSASLPPAFLRPSALLIESYDPAFRACIPKGVEVGSDVAVGKVEKSYVAQLLHSPKGLRYVNRASVWHTCGGNISLKKGAS